jgi:hypothetical protein
MSTQPHKSWVDEFGVLWEWDQTAEQGEGRFVPKRKVQPGIDEIKAAHRSTVQGRHRDHRV